MFFDWSTLKKLIWLRAAGVIGAVWKTITNIAVAAFTAVAAPVRELVVDIDPVQDLHGYANPWPAGGGKNLYRGKAYFHDKTYSLATVTAGETYTISAKKPSSNTHQYNYAYLKSDDSWEAKGGLIIRTATSSSVTVTIPAGVVGINVYDTDATPSNDIQIQVELGNQATTFAPYSNICPISGWTGANVWVEPTHDTTAAPKVTIDLDGTVYGGTLDVTTGLLTVTHTMLNLKGHSSQYSQTYDYDGKHGVTLYGVLSKSGTRQKGLCSMSPVVQTSAYSSASYMWFGVSSKTIYWIGILDVLGLTTYSEFATWIATNDVYIYCELATPQVIQLTPTEVTTLLGQNNVWADTGNINTITYRES